MFKFIAELKELRQPTIRPQVQVLLMLNRRLPMELEEFVQHIDAKNKQILSIELVHDDLFNKIHFFDSSVALAQQKTNLTWSKVEVNGPQAELLSQRLLDRQSLKLPNHFLDVANRAIKKDELCLYV